MSHEAEPATVFISDYAQPENPEVAALLVQSFAATVYRNPVQAHQTLVAAGDMLASPNIDTDLAKSDLTLEQQAFIRKTAELLGATVGGRCLAFDDATEEAIDAQPELSALRQEAAAAAEHKRSDYPEKRLKAVVSSLGFFTKRVVEQQVPARIPRQRNKSTRVSS